MKCNKTDSTCAHLWKRVWRIGVTIWGTMVIPSSLPPRKGNMTAGEFPIPLFVWSTEVSLYCSHTNTYGDWDMFGSLIPRPIPELKEPLQSAPDRVEPGVHFSPLHIQPSATQQMSIKALFSKRQACPTCLGYKDDMGRILPLALDRKMGGNRPVKNYCQVYKNKQGFT